MITIHPSSRFKRSFKKMPKHIQQDFGERVAQFAKNPFHTHLKTHKLHGRLGDDYAFCLMDGYRVLFDFVDNNIVLLVNIGDHDEYKKWART